MRTLKKISILFLYAIITTGCENVSIREENKVLPEEINDSISDVTHSKKNETHFNTPLFLTKIDSFISTITKLKHPFVCIIDTTKSRLLNTEENNIILEYNFDCGDHFKKLTIIESHYKDSAGINEAFMNLADEINLHPPPCITYGNDFVIRSKNTIYWFNSYCYYPYQNFIKIARLFESSLAHFDRTDSLKCVCGGRIPAHE